MTEERRVQVAAGTGEGERIRGFGQLQHRENRRKKEASLGLESGFHTPS